MQFQLTEEQLMIQSAARDFAQNDCKPGVIERDEHQKFPAEQVKKLGELFRNVFVSRHVPFNLALNLCGYLVCVGFLKLCE